MIMIRIVIMSILRNHYRNGARWWIILTTEMRMTMMMCMAIMTVMMIMLMIRSS